MINSEGSGMQADSMAMRSMTPTYPPLEMTQLMKTNRCPMMVSIMDALSEV
jgi:hypothetical protein